MPDQAAGGALYKTDFVDIDAQYVHGTNYHAMDALAFAFALANGDFLSRWCDVSFRNTHAQYTIFERRLYRAFIDVLS